MASIPSWRESVPEATCGAELINGGRFEWCGLPPDHPGPHTNTTGVRWKDGGPVKSMPDPNAPQVHRVDRCANLTCSNKPGEGTFTVFAVPGVVFALCAPCGEKLKGRVWV